MDNQKVPTLIAHRGNIDGRNPDRENHPDYIHEAICEGFDVEIDLWKIGTDFMLGHDKPRHIVDYEFLLRKAPRLWVHGKDLQCLSVFANDERFNVFCHSNDPRTITTKGSIWTRSLEEDFDSSSVVLILNYFPIPRPVCGGVCTNFPRRFREDWSLELS